MPTAVAETVRLLTDKAMSKGFDVREEPSPVSNTVYVELTRQRGWVARIRVSDHSIAGRLRYPLEIRTTDPESVVDDVIASLLSQN